VLRAVADDPSHLKKIWNVLKVSGPTSTFRKSAQNCRNTRAGLFRRGHCCGKTSIGQKLWKSATAWPTAARYRAWGIHPGGREACGQSASAVPFEHACFATLGSIATNGVALPNISLGEKVAVIGLGLVGQLIAQLSRLAGSIRDRGRPETRSRGVSPQAWVPTLALVSGSQIQEQVLALSDGQVWIA